MLSPANNPLCPIAMLPHKSGHPRSGPITKWTNHQTDKSPNGPITKRTNHQMDADAAVIPPHGMAHSTRAHLHHSTPLAFLLVMVVQRHQGYHSIMVRPYMGITAHPIQQKGTAPYLHHIQQKGTAPYLHHIQQGHRTILAPHSTKGHCTILAPHSTRAPHHTCTTLNKGTAPYLHHIQQGHRTVLAPHRLTHVFGPDGNVVQSHARPRL